MRWSVWQHVSVGLVVLLGVGVWAAGQDSDSAYRQIDRDRVIEQLRQMGMTQLLEAFVKMGSDSVDPRQQQRQLASVRIAQATAPGVPLARQDALLDEAIAMLRKLIDEFEPENPEEQLELYRLKFEEAKTIVELRCGPYVERLMNLRGGEADRKLVLELTERPVMTMVRLVADITELIQELQGGGGSRETLRYFVLVVPELQQLQKEADYKAAWTYYYRAMVSEPATEKEETEKARLLEDAIDRVEEFAEGEYSVTYNAILLKGRCYREMKEFDRAMEQCKRVASANEASMQLQIEALFEIPRILVAQGDYAGALSALRTYKARGVEIVGQANRLFIDLNASMLGHHIYKLQADRQDDAAEKRRLELQAQEAFVTFIRENPQPGVRSAYYDIVATMYRDKEDTDKLSSIVLLAKADQERIKWRRAKDAGDDAKAEEHKAKVIELLKIIIEREDDLSKELRPDAQEMLAFLGRDPIYFLNLAKELNQREPGSLKARQMAENAVLLLENRLYDLRQRNASIPADMRRQFLEATRFLLSEPKWIADKPELQRWHFDMGWHFARLAGEAEGAERQKLYDQAVAAYGKVPAEINGNPNTRQHAEAQYLALEARVYVFLTAEKADEDTALQLRSDLRAFGGYVKRSVGGVSDQPKLVQQLNDWGSLTEFWAAELMYEPLSRPQVAIRELADFPERWPGTNALELSAELEIRVLVFSGQASQAVAKLKSFMAQYPDRAEQLIQLVVEQVRQRINKMRWDPSASQEALQQLRKDYHELGKALFAEVKNRPLAERYRQTQMLAEALYEVGKADEALELFLACKSLGDETRKTETETINRTYASRQAALREVTADPKNTEGLVKLKDEFLEILRGEGLGESHRDIAQLVEAAEELTQATTDDARQAAARLMAKALRDGYRYQKDRQIASQPMDPANIHGIARCQIAKGQLAEGLANYRDLIDRTDRERFSVLYWQFQLERLQAALEGAGEDTGILKGVIRNIIQLRYETGGGLGGKRREFERMERKAKDRLVELNDPWEDVSGG
ncbi:MAG: hypothetical protein ACYS8X_00465 [Planctomycetota bacterium]